jgi:tetratricopeptide (TPR) repeat protein
MAKESLVNDTTAVDGITYHSFAAGTLLNGRDGRVAIPLYGLPIPILAEDLPLVAQGEPHYDAIGRGIHYLLRAQPDCLQAERYARLLKDGYPHLLAELANEMLMLHLKEVEVPYIDRKISYLKVFALLEPQSHSYPFEIGLAYLEKGLRMSALHLSSQNLYRAEAFLKKALELAPDDLQVERQLAEVDFLLGHYDEATERWRRLATATGDDSLNGRADRVAAGEVPRVPPVDYLEAIGMALAAMERQEHDEAAAIIHDILDDTHFTRDFPLAQLHFVLGSCYTALAMPRYAEEAFDEALRLDPDYREAEQARSALLS